MEINESQITPPRLVDIARLVGTEIELSIDWGHLEDLRYGLYTSKVQGITPIGALKRPKVDTESKCRRD